MSRWMHGVAAGLHLAQAVASAGVVGADSKNAYKWPITTLGWEKVLTDKTVGVNLGWLIPPFFLLSSVNHSISFFSEDYRSYVETTKTNPVRWCEYALSAGLMTFILGDLSGVLEQRSLVSMLFANMAMQFIGWEVEHRKAQGASLRELIGLTVIGWLMFMTIWVQIIISFVVILTLDSKVKAPAIVYGILGSLFLLFCSFGLNQILYVLDYITFKQYEMGYIVLSLTAKSILAWEFVGGITSGKERFKDTEYAQ